MRGKPLNGSLINAFSPDSVFPLHGGRSSQHPEANGANGPNNVPACHEIARGKDHADRPRRSTVHLWREENVKFKAACGECWTAIAEADRHKTPG